MTRYPNVWRGSQRWQRRTDSRLRPPPARRRERWGSARSTARATRPSRRCAACRSSSPPRSSRRSWGPSGSGKSTLLHCLAGLDTPSDGQVFIGDVDLTIAVREGSHAPAARRGRLRLPGVQPGADADGGGEHHAAARHRRARRRPGVVRPGGRHRRGCATGSATGRTSSPAGSSSGSPAPVRWSAARRSSSPTSRPGTSTRGRAPSCWGSCGRP